MLTNFERYPSISPIGRAAPLDVSDATHKIVTSLKKVMNDFIQTEKPIPCTSSDKCDNDGTYCKVGDIKIFPTSDIYFFHSTSFQ